VSARLVAHRTQQVTLTASSEGFVDLTDEVEQALERSGIDDGQVTVFCSDRGCALLVQEREKGLMLDIRTTLQRLGAGRSADAGSLIGSSSVVLPAVAGRLRLGTWQRVLLVETEAARARTVHVHIVGW
jgi:secondary thiamine-phosphate synthase enzyme